MLSRLLILSVFLGPIALAESPTEPSVQCAAAVTSDRVEMGLDTAQAAWVELDVDGFKASTDALLGSLPCVKEELIPPLIARIHRFVGLRRFVEGDQAGAEAAFAASRLIEPRYHFPTSLVPAGNPVIDLFEGVNVGRAEHTVIPGPVEGSIRLDGRLTVERVPDWPLLFQRFDADGDVVETAYVPAGTALPSYEQRLGAGPDAEALPPWLGPAIGGAFVVAGVGLYTVGYRTRNQYLEKKQDGSFSSLDEADDLRARANALGSAGVAATALGAVGIGISIKFGGK